MRVNPLGQKAAAQDERGGEGKEKTKKKKKNQYSFTVNLSPSPGPQCVADLSDGTVSTDSLFRFRSRIMAFKDSKQDGRRGKKKSERFVCRGTRVTG